MPNVQEKNSFLSFKVIAAIALIVLCLVFVFNFGIDKSTTGGEPKELPLLDSENIVILTPHVFETLRNAYRISENERLFCLIGEKVGNEILIQDIKEEPTMYLSKSHLRSSAEFACQIPQAIGTLHFHLPDSGASEFLCEPSVADIYTFGTLAVNGQGHIIQAVQCGEERFSFFDTSIGGNESFKIETFKWEVRDS